MANGKKKNGKNGKNGKRDWLENYLSYTSEQESPSMFHLWVGLSVLASALERRVFIDRGYYKLYPNLYIVLVGPSARVKKTTAIGIGERLMREAVPSLNVVSQKTTPEALIQFIKEGGKDREFSPVSIVASELSVFLGRSAQDASLIQLLTKLYDCEEVLDYHTIVRGREICNKPCCNMLAATTPDWIKSSMPTHAIGGGFTSRILFVYQFNPEKLIPFPSISSHQKAMRERLVGGLKEISKLSGKYTLTEDAKDWFYDWYTQILKTERGEGTMDGYYGRKPDTLLKVAMLLSASRGGKLSINEVDVQMALRTMNENEKYMPEVYRSVMTTQVGEESGKVYRTIVRRKEVDYTQLLRSVSYCMDARRLNEVIQGLIEEEKVVEEIKGGKRYFKVAK